jgi:hypothetical protein
MPAWIGYIISGLIGAMVTGASMTIFIVNRLSKVETRVDGLEREFVLEKGRTDARIFELAGMMKAQMAIATEVLKQNSVLVTTAEVLIRELREGRKHG